MTAFRWIEGVGGEIVADGKRLEAIALRPAAGGGADDRHAARGARLRRALARLSGKGSRPRPAGASSPIRAPATAGRIRSRCPRPLDYMTREARSSLPAVLDAIGFKRGILLGHSDGASIAAIYAGEHADERVKGLVLMAPHVFTEEPGLASIAEARRAYETGDLRARLAKYHADVDIAFRGWNDAWLDPGFKAWNIEDAVGRWRVPALLHPGRGRPVRHARANPRHRGAISRAGQEPHSRPLPPFAAGRAAAGDARRDRRLLRRGRSAASGLDGEGKPRPGAGKQSRRKESKGKSGRKAKGRRKESKASIPPNYFILSTY